MSLQGSSTRRLRRQSRSDTDLFAQTPGLHQAVKSSSTSPSSPRGHACSSQPPGSGMGAVNLPAVGATTQPAPFRCEWPASGLKTELHLCGANALRPAIEGEGGFSFVGPYRLNDKPNSNRSEIWRETLERSGRLHPITEALPDLHRIGARRFCWLKPHEEVTPHEGTWPNGGFAFFYDDPNLACVFRVSRVLPRSENLLNPHSQQAEQPADNPEASDGGNGSGNQGDAPPVERPRVSRSATAPTEMMVEEREMMEEWRVDEDTAKEDTAEVRVEEDKAEPPATETVVKARKVEGLVVEVEDVVEGRAEPPATEVTVDARVKPNHSAEQQPPPWSGSPSDKGFGI